MTKLIHIAFFFLLATLFSQAQNESLDKLIEKFGSKEGFTTVSLSDPAVMLSEMSDVKDAGALKNALAGVENLKVLSFAKGKSKNPGEGLLFIKDVRKFEPGAGFSTIMNMNDKESNIKVMVKKQGEKISDFVMTVSSPQDAVIIWMDGTINLKQISTIGRLLNIKGADKIKDLE
ncbi:MAG: DUF4252 domain-containing protein [Desulfobulbaceae bacterium]|nr:DUF4252 domain-containing protein [Candidatus Kapabacteria bacterium]MBS3999376.1 DUF4252 domain-containing protein [Desulfobulbaceae bacterium]